MLCHSKTQNDGFTQITAARTMKTTFAKMLVTAFSNTGIYSVRGK